MAWGGIVGTPTGVSSFLKSNSVSKYDSSNYDSGFNWFKVSSANYDENKYESNWWYRVYKNLQADVFGTTWGNQDYWYDKNTDSKRGLASNSLYQHQAEDYIKHNKDAKYSLNDTGSTTFYSGQAVKQAQGMNWVDPVLRAIDIALWVSLAADLALIAISGGTLGFTFASLLTLRSVIKKSALDYTAKVTFEQQIIIRQLQRQADEAIFYNSTLAYRLYDQARALQYTLPSTNFSFATAIKYSNRYALLVTRDRINSLSFELALSSGRKHLSPLQYIRAFGYGRQVAYSTQYPIKGVIKKTSGIQWKLSPVQRLTAKMVSKGAGGVTSTELLRYIGLQTANFYEFNLIYSLNDSTSSSSLFSYIRSNIVPDRDDDADFDFTGGDVLDNE